MAFSLRRRGPQVGWKAESPFVHESNGLQANPGHGRLTARSQRAVDDFPLSQDKIYEVQERQAFEAERPRTRRRQQTPLLPRCALSPLPLLDTSQSRLLGMFLLSICPFGAPSLQVRASLNTT